MKRSQNNEEQLYKQLTKFFNRLKKEVLKALEEYWSDYQLFQGQVNLICSPVHEAHREYYEILEKYKKREYRLGVKEAERQVKNENRKHKIALKAVQTFPISSFIKKDKDALFGTLPSAEQDMLNKTFTASERTLSRVDSQINQIITDGYRQGYGINQIANDLTRRFDQLSTWESKRIARTEIHGSHNTAVMDTYRDMDVEYIQWDAAGDDRTRDSHVEIDGEIIPLGSTFSNGLQFPGDTSGPIEEWINCRCSNAPFVVPYGYLAPSFSPFREEDLVPIDNKPNYDDLIRKATDEMRANLPHEQVFDQARFDQLKTHEEVAEFFGLEYIPQGRYYEQANIKTFEFYDPKTDTVLRFVKEGEQKCQNIDFTNSGKCEYDLKEVVRIYEETHPNLKVGLDDLMFLKGDQYTPAGDAGGNMVRIYDEGLTHGFSRRGIAAEQEPFEHTLDHELGHIFDNTFVKEGEFERVTTIAHSIERPFEEVGNKDIEYQKSKGLPIQKTSDYAETNLSENFAEVVGAVGGLKRGLNYKIYAERIERPAPERPRGFIRDSPLLTEAKSRNPNQFNYVESLIENPEQIMPNWKQINQQRVEATRERVNNLLKEEQKVLRM